MRQLFLKGDGGLQEQGMVPGDSKHSLNKDNFIIKQKRTSTYSSQMPALAGMRGTS